MMGEGIKIITSNSTEQIFIWGVDGAGKKSVASLLFPDCQYRVQRINSRKKTLILVLLDGVHQQNLAEEQLLKKLAKLQRKYTTKSYKKT